MSFIYEIKIIHVLGLEMIIIAQVNGQDRIELTKNVLYKYNNNVLLQLWAQIGVKKPGDIWLPCWCQWGENTEREPCSDYDVCLLSTIGGKFN